MPTRQQAGISPRTISHQRRLKARLSSESTQKLVRGPGSNGWAARFFAPTGSLQWLVRQRRPWAANAHRSARHRCRPRVVALLNGIAMERDVAAMRLQSHQPGPMRARPHSLQRPRRLYGMAVGTRGHSSFMSERLSLSMAESWFTLNDRTSRALRPLGNRGARSPDRSCPALRRVGSATRESRRRSATIG